MSQTDHLQSQLKRLSLHTMADIFHEEALKASKTDMTYTAFLARLVDEELAAKIDRSVNARIQRARLPMLRTLEAFDFSFQPSLPAARVRELAELGFLDRAENVLFVGQPGVGKTHLALAFALRVCQARKRVLFFQAMDLLDDLLAAEISRDLQKRIETLGRLDLLVVDELGYLPMDSRRASLFFQLVNHLYTRASIVLTTNMPFDAWGTVFGDNVIAAAILDRLLHYSHVFSITGPSYRMKGKLTQPLDGHTELVHDAANPLPQGVGQFSDGNLGQV
jgi:DNA replication protein DnaC